MSNARFGLRVRNGLVRGITEGFSAADPDVAAFILATGITDPNQILAIQQLVLNFKTFGLWTKLRAIYPFVGGTASAHRFNLKNPQDTNAAFRLIFFGGWTHSANGATPNGTNGYANTFLTPSIILTQNSTHLSFYSRTNISSNQIELNSTTSLGVIRLGMEISYNGNFSSDQYNFNTGRVSVINNNSTGYYIASRTSSNVHKAFKNGIQLGTTNTGAPDNLSSVNSPLYLSSQNENGTPLFFSSKQCAFASIGDGLTDTEAANLYTAVQAFQTTLGRQV